LGGKDVFEVWKILLFGKFSKSHLFEMPTNQQEDIHDEVNVE